MTPAIISFVVLAVIILLLIARVIYRLILGESMTAALIQRDNKAAAIALGGFLLGVVQVIIPVLSAPSHSLYRDTLGVAFYGGLGIVGMAITGLLFERYSQITGLPIQEDIRQGNVAAGIVAAGVYYSASAIVAGVMTGDGGAFAPTVVFWLAGTIALLVITHVFRQLTSYDDVTLINQGSVAAACGYAGLVVAIGLMIGHAVSGTFTDYGTAFRDFGLMLMITLAFYPVRQIVVQMLILGGGFSLRNGRLDHEIAEDNNVGAGVLEAFGYLATALVVTRIF